MLNWVYLAVGRHLTLTIFCHQHDWDSNVLIYPRNLSKRTSFLVCLIKSSRTLDLIVQVAGGNIGGWWLHYQQHKKVQSCLPASPLLILFEEQIKKCNISELLQFMGASVSQGIDPIFGLCPSRYHFSTLQWAFILNKKFKKLSHHLSVNAA